MGADGFNGEVKISVDLRHLPAAPYTQAAGADYELIRRYTQNGAADCDRVLYQTGSIATSSDEDIDLQTALDGFGDALSANKVVGLVLVAGTANDDNITVETDAANPWLGMLTAGSSIKVRPGCTLAAFSPSTASANRWDVSAGSKVLRLTNQSGTTAATYTLLVMTLD